METNQNSTAKKVILSTNKKYSPEYKDLLAELVERKIELFCAIGEECEIWEEALDSACFNEKGKEIGFVVTTSHPNETLEEVKEFAKQWSGEGNSEIQIIKI